MKKEMILHADLLDIVFDDRNKSYGAYPLRKYYPRRLHKSLVIVIGGAFLLALFIYFQKNGKSLDPAIFHAADPGYTTISTEIVSPPPPLRPPTIRPHTSGRALSSHVVIVDNTIISAPVTTDPGNGEPGRTVSNPGDAGPGDAPAGPAPIAQVVPVVVPADDPNEVLNVAEVMPSYPGGQAALQKFMSRNLVYPDELDEGETINVRIRFIVGMDGNLRGFDVVQDGGRPYNEEVIRVLKKMPQWVPGKSRGKNVQVYFTMPVKFVRTQD